MANYQAIHSVGFSLVRYLQNAYQASGLSLSLPCDFRLYSSGDMTKDPPGNATASLYLYKVTMNQHLRNTSRQNDPLDAMTPLAVDLHYLLNVWTDSSETEHSVLGWIMRELYLHETLSASDLSTEAEWGGGDVIQLIPAELTVEELFRIWDSLKLSYRLSVSYIARVVRIDVPVESTKPVVARRITVTDKEASR
jgi:hypothetical protein